MTHLTQFFSYSPKSLEWVRKDGKNLETSMFETERSGWELVSSHHLPPTPERHEQLLLIWKKSA